MSLLIQYVYLHRITYYSYYIVEVLNVERLNVKIQIVNIKTYPNLT
jgi:hypothetical protein